MPLVKSKSKRAFRENVRKEVDAGKPVKQAVAIAYDVKRRSGGARHSKLDHKKVSAWTKGDRRDYR